jgi:hypothetical protein
MYRLEKVKCVSEEEVEHKEEEQDDEDFHWGEGCCEDVLMDDEFYEREYCD